MNDHLYGAVHEELKKVKEILNPGNSKLGLIIEHCNVYSSQENTPLGDVYFTFNVRFSLHGVLHRIQCSDYVTSSSVSSIPDLIKSELLRFLSTHRAA